MEYSKELTAFKRDFELSTGIKTHGMIEERTFFHWKRLVLDDLTAKELTAIDTYFRQRFYQKGKFTHELPEIHSYNYLGGCYLVVTVDIELIQKFILKTKENAVSI
jgi:hypothetical protein